LFGRVQCDAVAVFGGAVGVARIDQDGSADSLRGAHAGAGEFHRRGLHLIRREYGSRRRGHTRNDHRKIVFLLFANASVRGGVLKSKW